MKQQIESFIDELKTNKKISTFDEASTKQAVVLRLLSFLGWDIFDVEEVCPNYSVNSHSASYALRAKNSNKVFIEVKRAQEKLDNHQKPLINFALREGVDLSILTNGVIWWFYLISAEGDWQTKWFLSIEILKQKSDHIASQLIDLLTKDNISKGQAVKDAKALYQDKNQKIAADFIPQAWNQIISQPNKIFVELLSDNTEKLCGYKVESAQIEKYLKKHLDKWLIENAPETSVAPPAKIIKTQILEDEPIAKDSVATKAETKQKPESYEGKTIKSFTFNGHTYKVRHWEEVLIKLCDNFAVKHKDDFEKVLWISGEDKTYFSQYKEQLSIPEKIHETGIYVETKLTPDEIVKTAKTLLTEFGYSRDKLIIVAE
jgi:predicted type IV restriction endonuclease